VSGHQELDRLIRMPELEVLTGLSRATIYRLIRQKRFAAPVALAANSRGWFASQVRAWQEGLKPAEPRPDTEAVGERAARRDGSRSPRDGVESSDGHAGTGARAEAGLLTGLPEELDR
jgi:prophage regulatory protein